MQQPGAVLNNPACRAASRRGGAWATLSLGQDARVRGDHARAKTLLDIALRWFQEHGNRRGILRTTQALRVLEHDRGDALAAMIFLREALILTRELGDRRGVYECLEWLAAVAGTQGLPVRAAHLHGAAEALRELIGTMLPPVDRALLEPDLESLLTSLGESAFAAATAEGRAMNKSPRSRRARAQATATSTPLRS